MIHINVKIVFAIIAAIIIAALIIAVLLTKNTGVSAMWLSVNDETQIKAIVVLDVLKESDIEASVVSIDKNVEKSLSKNEIEKIIRLITNTGIKTVIKNPRDSDYDQSDNSSLLPSRWVTIILK